MIEWSSDDRLHYDDKLSNKYLNEGLNQTDHDKYIKD